MSQQPCFAVSKKRRINQSEGITFRDVDTIDAQTYLARVVAEANQLPEHFTAAAVVTTQQSLSKPSQHRTSTATSSAASLVYLLSPQSSLTPPPSAAVLPANPRAWVDACCADFEQLRTYLQKIKAHLGKERRFPYKLPLLRDRASWHIFCVGAAEAQGNVGSYFDDGDDDSQEGKQNNQSQKAELDVAEVDKESSMNQKTSEDEEEEEEWRQHLPPTGYEPDASLLLQMDQVMVTRIVSHLAYYSHQGWQMTANRASWCYALLARLETPLHREQAVVLYDWLKALTAQRAQDRLSAQELASLNIIITIVAIYLEQGGGFAATMHVPATAT